MPVRKFPWFRLIGTMYLGACLYFGKPPIILGNGNPPVIEPCEKLWHFVGNIADPVLRLICQIIACAVIGVAGLSAFLGALIWLAFVFALLIVWVIYDRAVWLYHLSPTGAAVVIGLGALVVFGMIMNYRAGIARVFRWIGSFVYGLLFDWWFTPILVRGRERRIMRDVDDKREQFEASIERLKAECPEVQDIPLSIGPADWLSHVAERFRVRQTEKTIAQKTSLLAQTRIFFEQYRAALDAEDNLKRARPSYKEKDEEEDLRKLERQKRKLALEMEIAEMKKRKDPPPPRQPLSEHEQVAEMKKQQKRDHEAYAGDPEMQAMSDRRWDDRIMRFLEGMK